MLMQTDVNARMHTAQQTWEFLVLPPSAKLPRRGLDGREIIKELAARTEITNNNVLEGFKANSVQNHMIFEATQELKAEIIELKDQNMNLFRTGKFIN